MRKEILLIALAALALPSVHLASAQHAKVPRIGYLAADPRAPTREAFRQGLRDFGYVEGESIFIEWRFTEDKTLPKLSRVAVMWSPDDSSARIQRQEIQTAAGALGIQLLSLEVRAASELDKAIETAARARVSALVVLRGGTSYLLRKQVIALAEKHRLPGMYFASEFCRSRRPNELLGE